MTVIGSGLRHTLKHSIADFLNAKHAHPLVRTTKLGGGGVLDVRAIGLLDLANDISNRRRPRPKGIRIQNKGYIYLRFDAGQQDRDRRDEAVVLRGLRTDGKGVFDGEEGEVFAQLSASRPEVAQALNDLVKRI